MIKKLTLLASLFLVLVSVRAQSLDQEKLNAYFTALDENNKFMGTVLLLKDGSPVYSRSVGYADFNTDRANSLDTEYRLGSISKTLTAILVMQAVEAGKLRLDQKLADFYPTVPNADRITVDHLLHHRSGLHSFTDDADYLTYNTQPKTEEEMLRLITKGPIRFEPDAKFEYCNSNYVLLSYILEKVHKKSFGQIFESGIIKPLKLKQTYFGHPDPKSKMANRSYVFDEQWTEETVTDMSIPMGAGGIVSTAGELGQLFHTLFTGKLLSEASLSQMTTMNQGYGKGIYTLPFQDKKGFGHNGAIDGYNTTAAYFPTENLAVIILANGINHSLNDIAIKLLSAYFGVPFEVPSFTTYPTKPGELAVFTGVYNSEQLPLELTVTDENDTLMIQATGQSKIPMDRTEVNTFTFDRAGITLIFDPDKKSVTLKQGGGEFLFEMKE